MRENTPKAIQDCHALILWLIPQLDKFPRTRRFTLGERLEGGLLEVLELLVEAAYARNKTSMLARANLRLETARHLWRLSYELKTISTRSYEHGARLTAALSFHRCRPLPACDNTKGSTEQVHLRISQCPETRTRVSFA